MFLIELKSGKRVVKTVDKQLLKSLKFKPNFVSTMAAKEDINDNRFPLFQRLLSTFKLSEEVLNKLKSNGFKLKTEIMNLTDERLQSICDLSDQQIEEINQKIRNSHKQTLNLIDFNQIEELEEYIHTGSHSLDRALNGGLQVSKITEISAEGGAGKTQICMQCCVNVQLPPECGGLSGWALYIDTEGSFRPDRIASMAEHRLAKHTYLKNRITVESIKSKIFLFRCITKSDDLFDLIINKIEAFIESKPKIRLLVIDSIAQLYRFDFRGTKEQKECQLTQIGQKLRVIAYTKKVAVLIANQVTYNKELDQTLPALGKHWQMNCNYCLFFKRLDYIEDNPRKCEIIRSNDTEVNQTFYFKITEKGITECVSGDDWHKNF